MRGPREQLRAHPWATPVAITIATVLAVAVLVLPRLDGVEVSARSTGPSGDGTERVDAHISFRLASAPTGTLTLHAVGEGVREIGRARVVEGRDELTMSATVAEAATTVIVAELRPDGAGDSLFDQMMRRRRRALSAIAPVRP